MRNLSERAEKGNITSALGIIGNSLVHHVKGVRSSPKARSRPGVPARCPGVSLTGPHLKPDTRGVVSGPVSNTPWVEAVQWLLSAVSSLPTLRRGNAYAPAMPGGAMLL